MDFIVSVFSALINIAVLILGALFALVLISGIFYLFYELIWKKLVNETLEISFSEECFNVCFSCGSLIFLIVAAYTGLFDEFFEEIKSIFA